MKKYKSYKDESRLDYGATIEEEEILTESSLKLGAILRIAGSLENMEKPFLGMISELRYHKECSAKLKKANAGLRGYITKLRKQAVGKG